MTSSVLAVAKAGMHAGELESESSLTTTAGVKMREVQAAAKQQQALATTLIKAGELANICRPLAYVIALRWFVPSLVNA